MSTTLAKKDYQIISVADDEVIARESYTLDSDLSKPALLKIKSDTVNQSIKITLWSGTVKTMNTDDVNEANLHVKRVWDTATVTTAHFYLWQ